MAVNFILSWGLENTENVVIELKGVYIFQSWLLISLLHPNPSDMVWFVFWIRYIYVWHMHQQNLNSLDTAHDFMHAK